MKILKEAKENLPLSFLTVMISKGWDEIGILKEQKEAINKTFKGTTKIEKLLQDLIDAHLVCIGQVEQLIQDKNYLDFPDTILADKDKSEDLKEAVTIYIDDEKPAEKVLTEIPDSIIDTVEPIECTGLMDNYEIPEIKNQDDLTGRLACSDCLNSESSELDTDEVDFDDVFNCDFAAPNPADKITDEDLYPEN